MKTKRWFKYFINILLIIIFVFWEHKILAEIMEVRKRTFQFNIYYQLFIMIIFNVGVGLLLGLENFIGEMRKEVFGKLIIKN